MIFVFKKQFLFNCIKKLMAIKIKLIRNIFFWWKRLFFFIKIKSFIFYKKIDFRLIRLWIFYLWWRFVYIWWWIICGLFFFPSPSLTFSFHCGRILISFLLILFFVWRWFSFPYINQPFWIISFFLIVFFRIIAHKWRTIW